MGYRRSAVQQSINWRKSPGARIDYDPLATEEHRLREKALFLLEIKWLRREAGLLAKRYNNLQWQLRVAVAMIRAQPPPTIPRGTRPEGGKGKGRKGEDDSMEAEEEEARDSDGDRQSDEDCHTETEEEYSECSFSGSEGISDSELEDLLSEQRVWREVGTEMKDGGPRGMEIEENRGSDGEDEDYYTETEDGYSECSFSGSEEISSSELEDLLREQKIWRETGTGMKGGEPMSMRVVEEEEASDSDGDRLSDEDYHTETGDEYSECSFSGSEGISDSELEGLLSEQRIWREAGTEMEDGHLKCIEIEEAIGSDGDRLSDEDCHTETEDEYSECSFSGREGISDSELEDLLSEQRIWREADTNPKDGESRTTTQPPSPTSVHGKNTTPLLTQPPLPTIPSHSSKIVPVPPAIQLQPSPTR